ncbi:hypothetical protein M8997_003945 [Phyllobacterium sp. 21LDTY02-6]|uniref:COG3904 family protein n=1 Tax=Phyllobacterium sp. 21LDTY02-6 TaxID=2944903 RepID=UPI0020218845|nr:hypothetical protein [Phyllobacterium sp. 21LDTY02-6]MCO4316325.1 hypothetical protein [Phyllobacterium sp. 21LDTY02-6]
MQFEYTEPQSELERMFGGHYSINLFGPIKLGDDIRFQEFLAQCAPPPRTPVYINSTGGDVETAIKIGQLIRGEWFSTHIGSFVLDHDRHHEHYVPRKHIPGRCLSAATLIYLGGRLRYFDNDAKFGVHQFSFKDPAPDHVGRSQVLSAKIARFIEDMGITSEFLNISTAAPGDKIKLLEADELERIGVVTGGETDVTWSMQARNNTLYIRGERDSLYGHHKVMLGHTRSGGFYFHAVIEAQGREDELISFPVVEINVEASSNNIDISERAFRAAVGIYVNVFAKLEHNEAAVIANSIGFGIQIRAAHDAGMFLGIAPMKTDNGKDQLLSFYNNLR